MEDLDDYLAELEAGRPVEKPLTPVEEYRQSVAAAGSITLTPLHRNLLNFIEHYWYQNQCYPSTPALARWAKDTDITFKAMRDLEFELSNYLGQRGITQRDQTSRLTDIQLASANLILNVMDRRSQLNKLKSLGVTPTQWQGWLKQKAFADYLKNRTGEMFEENLHMAHLGLMKSVEDGNATSLKLFYEMTGVYRSDSPVANVQVILAQIIEVIQREVPDAEIQRRIAAGFELVMLRNQAGLTGGTPQPVEGDRIPSPMQNVKSVAIEQAKVVIDAKPSAFDL